MYPELSVLRIAEKTSIYTNGFSKIHCIYACLFFEIVLAHQIRGPPVLFERKESYRTGGNIIEKIMDRRSLH